MSIKESIKKLVTAFETEKAVHPYHEPDYSKVVKDLQSQILLSEDFLEAQAYLLTKKQEYADLISNKLGDFGQGVVHGALAAGLSSLWAGDSLKQTVKNISKIGFLCGVMNVAEKNDSNHDQNFQSFQNFIDAFINPLLETINTKLNRNYYQSAKEEAVSPEMDELSGFGFNN